MIRLFLLIGTLVISVTSFSQKDSVRKFLDADLRFTNKKNFVYAAMALKTNDHWLLHAVYPDTSVLLRVYFKDAALTIRDGIYELYHSNKTPAQKGTFKNNIAGGLWQSWYRNGQLKSEGLIVNNHLHGEWKYFYENGQPMRQQTYLYTDSMARQAGYQNSFIRKWESLLDNSMVNGKMEGPATTWYKNGNKESVVNYHNDSLSGVCSWFRENGQPSSRETYTSGKITDLACYDTLGKYTGATCSVLKMPQLIHPFFNAVDYIEYELHKEKHKNIAEGDAEINFIVTEKGTVENLVFLSSPDEGLTKLIRQIFATMPAWSPAVKHNCTISFPMGYIIPWYRD